MHKSMQLVAAAVGVTLLSFGVGGAAQAQTVVNLTNLDPSVATGFGFTGTGAVSSATNLNLLNSTTVLSNGGVFGGAVSTIPGQQATNQVNTLGMTATGGVAPVVLGNQAGVAGGNSVTINEITSAYNGSNGAIVVPGTVNGTTSTTINNVNSAVSSGVNQIIGAGNALNNVFTGGYGGTSGGASVSGNQVGVNTINGAGAAFASGTAVTLGQQTGAPTPATGAGSPVGSAPIIQGGALNMSTVNTLTALTSAGPASVGGSTIGSSGAVTSGGVQQAVNTFNTATLQGNNLAVGAQQLADGLNQSQTGLQSVNRALAYSATGTLGNVSGTTGGGGASSSASVSNLGQTANVGINALNIVGLPAAGSTANGSTTLSGLQSTGYNTSGVAGSLAVPAATNQAVASTVTSGGAVPALVTVGAVANWSPFAAAAGASAAPSPNVLTSTSAGNQLNTNAYVNSNVGGASGVGVVGVGSTSVNNLTQSVGLSNNTVSVGSTAAPVDTTFASTGFQQRTGTIGLAPTAAVTTATGVSALAPNGTGTAPQSIGTNSALALTGAGASSIATLGQTVNSVNNTFSGVGNASGTLTQSATGINFAAGSLVAPGSTGTSTVINSGGSTGYNVSTATLAPTLNNAVAGTQFGTSGLSAVSQTGNTYTNIASATGNIDTSGAGGSASGTITQQLDSITNYGTTAALNSQAAVSSNAGAASVTGASQGLTLFGNALSAGGTLSGSVAQQGPSGGDIGNPQNAILSAAISGSTGQGAASLTSSTQSNQISLNSISAGGALGAGTPVGLSQTSGSATLDANGNVTAVSPLTINSAGVPSNTASVSTFGGAGGNASTNGLTQLASANVNSLSGGSATTGAGLTGAATQVSYGLSSTIGNNATASALTTQPGSLGNGSTAGTNGLGVTGVMSGNATLTNLAQGSSQSLNTMALAGASNGILNQATIGATTQNTVNTASIQANAGYGIATGTQTASNAVNVITSK